MLSDIEFGNDLTEGTNIESEKERALGALGDTEGENYSLRKSYHLF